jgi:hypothetical protein
VSTQVLCRGCHRAARAELKVRKRREAEAATEERRGTLIAQYAALVEANEVQLQDALLRSYTEGEELGKRQRRLVGALPGQEVGAVHRRKRQPANAGEERGEGATEEGTEGATEGAEVAKTMPVWLQAAPAVVA